MTFAREELARRKAAYEAACKRWYDARDAGNIVREEDERERATGVRWRAVDAVGRVVLSAFQVAKSELDHIDARVRREAGDLECHTCKPLEKRPGFMPRLIPADDPRLPPEHDDEEAPL